MKPKGGTYRSKAFKIGVATVVAMILFFIGGNFLKGVTLLSKTKKYYVFFEDIGGLAKSSSVVLNGMKIGKVHSIDFDYNGLTGSVLRVELDNNLRIPVGTQVKVNVNPLEGAKVQLLLPKLSDGATYGTYLAEGDTLYGVSTPDLFTQIQEEVLPNLVETTQMVDTLLYSFNQLVSNENIPQTLEWLKASAQNIQHSSAQLRGMMSGQIPRIVNSIDSSAVAVQDFTAKVQRADIEKALSDFVAVVDDLQRLSHQVSTQVSKKNNNLGLLLNDSTLYHKLLDTSVAADSLLRDIQANPKRYVRFSLF